MEIKIYYKNGLTATFVELAEGEVHTFSRGNFVSRGPSRVTTFSSDAMGDEWYEYDADDKIPLEREQRIIDNDFVLIHHVYKAE